MAEPLATLNDVIDRLGRDLTAGEAARIDALLLDVSASVRKYTGQDFTEATTTLRTRVRRGVVTLPQRPVTAVTSVDNVATSTATFFRWDGLDRVTFAMSELDAWQWEPFRIGTGPPVVDIEYTHGYDPIPDDIIGVVSSIAMRALGRKPEEGAVQQESIAGYSYSIGSAGAAGGFGMLPDERSVLDRYRRVGGWVDVTGAS